MMAAERLSLPPPALARLADHLAFLYGEQVAPRVLNRLETLLGRHLQPPLPRPPSALPYSQRDVFLITYPDQVQARGQPPLLVLINWLGRRLADLISGIHLLPFFPSSSDDGFSVIDYRAVDPDLGTWDAVEQLASRYRLMVDVVLNHVSASSAWFQSFLNDDPETRDFFITLDPTTDLAAVVRPRPTPLLTAFDTAGGTRYLWTTFSADQIDLNYANPDVLLAMLDVLLDYVRRGAQVLRLDAVAFLWKQPGTSCVHLPQTHRLVRLIRTVLEVVAPWVRLLTETNVPQTESLSYFGDGHNEAHWVYQFTLPPLVLHTFLSGDATCLTEWLSPMKPPSPDCSFFNFLASHDGTGLRPVDGILSPEQIDALVNAVQARGGRVSYRTAGAGRQEPYELNLTYFDALNDPAEAENDPDTPVARFLTSQAILLSLAGIPALYFHSLLGSRSDFAAYRRTGHPRSLNRQKLSLASLEAMLNDPRSRPARVFHGLSHLLRLRQSQPAFHPAGPQEVLSLAPDVFAVLRTSPSGDQRVLCLHRVQHSPAIRLLRFPLRGVRQAMDLVSGETLSLGAIPLAPYQVRWLRLDEA